MTVIRTRGISEHRRRCAAILPLLLLLFLLLFATKERRESCGFFKVRKSGALSRRRRLRGASATIVTSTGAHFSAVLLRGYKENRLFLVLGTYVIAD